MAMAERPPDVPAPPYEAAVASQPGSTGAHKKQHDGSRTNVMDIDQVVSSHPLSTLSLPPIADLDAKSDAAFSVDDLEVAKALTGLREGTAEPAWREPADQTPTSPAQSTATLRSGTYAQSPTATPAGAIQPEPLLSLLTSQHPLIASTINNSISAYSSSKTYSTRFRQGAEFVERNIASPVANTVGTAGRISGVETGVRWMLRRTASSASSEHEPAGNKRRKLDPDADAMDGVERPDAVLLSRAASDLSQHEFLPAYDDNRSPVYEECAVVPASEGQAAPQMPQNWQTRLMISTSGLGIAMSDESLRSLKYCLSWLRWANSHLNKVLLSLHSVLREWEQSQASANSGTEAPSSAAQPRDPAAIAQSLTALRAECVKTLKGALDVVSTYAGGALPENARVLVRKHLTSLPLRFQLASGNSGSARPARTGSASPAPVQRESEPDVEAQAGNTPEAVSSARRVIVLAREGIDMMAQVGAVVDGTINSAEEWCERLGRRRGDADQQPAPVQLALQSEQKTPPAPEQPVEQQLQSMRVGPAENTA